MIHEFEKIKVLIEDLSDRAEGIGHYEGRAVFVKGAFPGEIVNVEITEDKGRIIKGRVEGYKEPLCSGAPLINMSYESQLAWKKKHVEDTLKRLGKIENPKVNDVVGMEHPYNYRNKGEFNVGDTRPLCCTACMNCPIQDKLALDIVKEFKENPVKNAERLIVRTTREGKVLSYTIQANGYPLIYKGRNLIEDHIGNLKIEVDAASFYQVNPIQCEKLYSIVKSYIDDGDSILDLYCGAGTIGLYCADKASRVIGVEVVKPAVIQANRNAVINGNVTATFICGKAEEVIDTKLQGVKADVVIVDPPRAGCKESLLRAISRINPERVVYVSCDPATLSRDLKILNECGYEMVEVTPVDMFPHTVHIENVVYLHRKS